MADFEDLLKRLVQHHLDFVIVGGYAAVAHGISYLTQDIDICCSFEPDNLLRLQQAVADLHPVHRMTPQRLALKLTRETCQDLNNLYIDTDLGQLDCLGHISGVGAYDQVKQCSIKVDLSFGPCRVLDLDALIESKKAMNRPRDREVLLQLKAIKERQKTPPQ
jgi:hypothetical protein